MHYSCGNDSIRDIMAARPILGCRVKRDKTKKSARWPCATQASYGIFRSHTQERTALTPLQAYLKTLRNALNRGELGSVMNNMAKFCGTSRLRLYQAANPEDPHILKPGPAMRLEIYTNGLVPAESTNPDMKAVMLTMPEWDEYRGIA